MVFKRMEAVQTASKSQSSPKTQGAGKNFAAQHMTDM
jgi:hypothetical protein